MYKISLLGKYSELSYSPTLQAMELNLYYNVQENFNLKILTFVLFLEVLPIDLTHLPYVFHDRKRLARPGC